MTVQALIDQLKQCAPELEVRVRAPSGKRCEATGLDCGTAQEVEAHINGYLQPRVKFVILE